MVKLRQRGARFQYDIRFRWPDGTDFRERANAPVAGRAAALRWAQSREQELLTGGKKALSSDVVERRQSAVSTLADFWPRVVRDHYKAQRKKASTVDAAESIYAKHLAPALGAKPLDTITTADIAALKGALSSAKPKTVNNVLSVLSRALKCAVRWGVITGPLPLFDLLAIPPGERDWYEVPEYRRLIDGAAKCGQESLIVCLLAGSAGLRLGEIRALKWTDIDLARRQVTISRNLWHEHEAAPKGGRGRVVPLTPELHAALRGYRHLRERVVTASIQGVRSLFNAAQRRAGLPERGGVHALRHTFCSHLAIAGVPAKAIQELAGHADLATTMRYMHLSPTNRSDAMAALAGLYAGSTASAKSETA